MNRGIFWQAFLAAWLMLPRLSAAAEAATIRGANTLVRSLPTRFSPSIAKLQTGDAIVVLEEIVLEKPAANDELRWLKIVCPTNATAWVSTLYVDTNLNTVSSTRLNVRAGPSESYPIIGRLQRGQGITNLTAKKGEWIKIPPPVGAFAFVAASLVNLPQKPDTEAPLPVSVTNVAPVIINETTAVSEAPVAAQPLEPTPATNPVPAITPALQEPTPAPANTTTVAPEPPQPRIVTREGLVSGNTSIQAPSYFKLENLETRRIMDYVRSPTTNLVLNRYVGRRVIVTGEEALDQRWPTIPVITIQRIQVVEE